MRKSKRKRPFSCLLFPLLLRFCDRCAEALSRLDAAHTVTHIHSRTHTHTHWSSSSYTFSAFRGKKERARVSANAKWVPIPGPTFCRQLQPARLRRLGVNEKEQAKKRGYPFHDANSRKGDHHFRLTCWLLLFLLSHKLGIRYPLLSQHQGALISVTTSTTSELCFISGIIPGVLISFLSRCPQTKPPRRNEVPAAAGKTHSALPACFPRFALIPQRSRLRRGGNRTNSNHLLFNRFSLN
uniref:Putative secreted protein n=1 Tax=Anopheles marajoara TaxID=58244 RepID=A0A2M4C5T6_9DIPT